MIFTSDYDILGVITITIPIQFIKATVQYWSGAVKCDFGHIFDVVYLPLRAGVWEQVKALSNNIIKKTFRESPYSLRLSTCTLSSDSSAIVFDDAAADK